MGGGEVPLLSANLSANLPMDSATFVDITSTKDVSLPNPETITSVSAVCSDVAAVAVVGDNIQGQKKSRWLPTLQPGEGLPMQQLSLPTDMARVGLEQVHCPPKESLDSGYLYAKENTKVDL